MRLDDREGDDVVCALDPHQDSYIIGAITKGVKCSPTDNDREHSPIPSLLHALMDTWFNTALNRLLGSIALPEIYNLT